jgi:hypothetical protein
MKKFPWGRIELRNLCSVNGKMGVVSAAHLDISRRKKKDTGAVLSPVSFFWQFSNGVSDEFYSPNAVTMAMAVVRLWLRLRDQLVNPN